MNQPKDKRGKQFIVIETGELVILNRIQNDGKYYVDSINPDGDIYYPSDLRPLNRNKVSSISNKPKPLTEKAKSDTQAMNEFFDSLVVPFNCQCCNKPLYAFSKVAKRSVSAHILPKANFESIKTNPNNIIFMGADYIGCPCSCHDRFDMNVDIRKSMPIYPLALERFELLKPHMTTAEVIEGYKYLGIELTQEILKQLK